MNEYIKNGIAISVIIIGGGILAFGSSDTPKKPKDNLIQKESSYCNSNYSGCVPIASDVDCAGGSGNGPKYVRGPVEVIGRDVYGLDRDNDGIGCERN